MRLARLVRGAAGGGSDRVFEEYLERHVLGHPRCQQS